jgi:tetratricopeptide (TPR) repeat protein
MSYYRRSLAADPQQPALILALVKWYETHKNWKMAYNDLMHGVEVLPQSADLRYQLGKFDMMAGNLPVAAAQLSIATRIEPHNTKANYRMALALMGLNRRREAIPYFRRVVKVSPQFVPGHVSYARCLFLMGHDHAALEQLRLAEKLAPNVPVIHLALAAVLKKLGHPRQAAAEKQLAASHKTVKK